MSLTWPRARAAELLEALATEAGLAVDRPAAAPPADRWDEGFGEWVESATAWMGLESEATHTSYADVEAVLLTFPGSGPANVRVLTAPPWAA